MRPDEVFDTLRADVSAHGWRSVIWSQFKSLLIPFFLILLPLFILSQIYSPHFLWLVLVLVPIYGWWVERRRKRAGKTKGELE